MPDSRPNIILIITDQQRYDTIAALGFPYMDTPSLDRLVARGRGLYAVLCHRGLLRAGAGQPVHRLLPAHHRRVQERRCLAARLGGALAAAGYHCVNIGKMHTYPYETPLGFHERFVVENKDRYLEGRYFFDRWDLALQAQGLVKQQRELYRQRARLSRAAGRLRVGTARAHPFRHVRGRPGDLVAPHQAPDPAALLADRLPRAAPAV